MAATLDQVSGFLAGRGLRYQREDARQMLFVPFRLEEIDRLVIVVKLEENGEFIKVLAPSLLTCPAGPHKLPLMETLLLISWETKMLQWEYDPTDGEVRAIIEFPLEDAPLTEAQFFRAFDGLAQMCRMFLPRLRQVAETGRDPARQGGVASSSGIARAFLEYVGGNPPGDGEDAPPDEL